MGSGLGSPQDGLGWTQSPYPLVRMYFRRDSVANSWRLSSTMESKQCQLSSTLPTSARIPRPALWQSKGSTLGTTPSGMACASSWGLWGSQ